MKTSQSFGVNFTIKKQKANKDGKTNVYACIIVNKEKVFLALKKQVAVEEWDYGRGSLKIKAAEAKDTNSYLEQVKFTITTYYQQLQIATTQIYARVLLKKISEDMHVLREKLEPSGCSKMNTPSICPPNIG